ncbi:UNVERIFIED_CONTAM: hypothetical protein HDU68_006370 [Siphonaria sp. JEL0065]|nr:hypothetical protein HDU68_006370 [Siphonaria sp. JEL0065]
MQIIASIIAAASLVAAQASSSTSAAAATSSGAAATTTAAAPAGTDGCTTKDGGRISIISPLQASVNQAGANVAITWNSNGLDSAFQAATIGFSIVDATNPNNAQPIAALSFATPPTTASGKATALIPATLPTSSKYALRSEYKDGSTWRYCFSTVFTINGAAAATTAPVSTSKSGAEQIPYVAAAAVIAAMAL